MFQENQQPAILTWAGIYSSGFHIETGNLVPPGEKIPSCVPDDRRELDWRCAYNHSIDTSIDRSLYQMQTAIEAFLMRDPAFNPSQKPRKDFQNGLKVDSTPRYTFQNKMFVRKYDRPQSAKDERRSKRMKWHPWIIRALEGKPQFFANPEKPTVTEWRSGQFHDISTCKPPYLQAGDVVWFSMKLTVHVTNSNWWRDFVAEEIV
ncbi:hypothetical protein K474DRAFT_1606688 [Panus rudis PR-1116 ss-1]|nr:hypothetical protein K474DRAFT_1606688 [Panus rudis PR-1116 ss-1]